MFDGRGVPLVGDKYQFRLVPTAIKSATVEELQKFCTALPVGGFGVELIEIVTASKLELSQPLIVCEA